MTNDLLHQLENGIIISEEALLKIRGGGLPAVMVVAVAMFAVCYVCTIGSNPVTPIKEFLNGLANMIESFGGYSFQPLPTSHTYQYKQGRYKKRSD